MNQPTREHRREIWSSLCIGYDAVSGIEWAKALDGGQAVGTCSACQQLLKPLPPEEVGHRVVYPARCVGCGREVSGMGPRPAKAKGGEA
jgi:hypothetical protein